MSHLVLTIYDDAIRQRRMLEIEYKGHRRVVQPHIHGENQQGHDALSGVQVAGGSNTGELGWKSFLLDEVRRPRLGTPFNGPASGYNPDDPAFVVIYSRL